MAGAESFVLVRTKCRASSALFMAAFSGAGSGEHPERNDRRQHQPTEMAVRSELRQAIGRVIQLHVLYLPPELRRRYQQGDRDPGGEPGDNAGERQEEDGRDIKAGEPRASSVAEKQGAGLHADERIVFLVLMRVDRVVAERPGDAGG